MTDKIWEQTKTYRLVTNQMKAPGQKPNKKFSSRPPTPKPSTSLSGQGKKPPKIDDEVPGELNEREELGELTYESRSVW